MAKNTKAAKSTKRRTTTKKLSAGEKELTAAEKKKVKGGIIMANTEGDFHFKRKPPEGDPDQPIVFGSIPK